MSMICWLLGLSSPQIGALRAEPSLARGVARAAQDQGMKSRIAEAIGRMPPEKREAAQAQYRAMFEQVPGAKEVEAQYAKIRANFEQFGPLEDALGLEKSWHMLHYLFTGQAGLSEAPGSALLTGEEIGEDMGYGPARLHDETETLNFAQFLATVDAAQLQERVNYSEMSRSGVYGMPWGGGSDSEFEDMLRADAASFFPRLRDYAVKMADKQNGLLIWLS